MKKWFITHGVYTSIHDPISKILQFDVDGDKSLVIQDEVLVNVAKRNMEGIVPLYYEMAKAPAEQLNSEDIYKSLVSAYKANIGEISNNITKIWNSNNVNLNVIKWLCMENNFTIDFAKTLYMPTRPEHVNEIISQYIKAKVPHFFIYAKDKEEKNVEFLNDSVVNKFEYLIPNNRINFKRIAGEFDFSLLMSRDNVKLNEKIIKTYNKLDKEKRWKAKYVNNDLNSYDTPFVYKQIREELLSLNNDPEYITDVLTKYLYETRKTNHKMTLWNSFGDVIVRNLKRNIDGMKACDCCGTLIKIKNNKSKYCVKCAKEEWRKYNAMKQREYRQNKKTCINRN
jgi:hypothetical protein